MQKRVAKSAQYPRCGTKIIYISQNYNSIPKGGPLLISLFLNIFYQGVGMQIPTNPHIISVNPQNLYRFVLWLSIREKRRKKIFFLLFSFPPAGFSFASLALLSCSFTPPSCSRFSLVSLLHTFLLLLLASLQPLLSLSSSPSLKNPIQAN